MLSQEIAYTENSTGLVELMDSDLEAISAGKPKYELKFDFSTKTDGGKPTHTATVSFVIKF